MKINKRLKGKCGEVKREIENKAEGEEETKEKVRG